jgi:hypothetical protein
MKGTVVNKELSDQGAAVDIDLRGEDRDGNEITFGRARVIL